MAVATRPPRVQFVGMLPAVLKPCGPACAQPFTSPTVRALEQEELDETPPFMRAHAERAHAFAEDLFREFGSAIRVEVVGLDSPRGLWLGIRHRIGKGFAVIVDGREVVRGPADYGPVRDAVARAVQAHAAAP